MEEENLNVDNCIYTSINNDKELLNLPDGSIIKRTFSKFLSKISKQRIVHVASYFDRFL